jgi:hypothetical protein
MSGVTLGNSRHLCVGLSRRLLEGSERAWRLFWVSPQHHIENNFSHIVSLPASKRVMDNLCPEDPSDELAMLSPVPTEEIVDLTKSTKGMAINSPINSTQTIKPRNYQLEMVRESLKRNIIVAVR